MKYSTKSTSAIHNKNSFPLSIFRYRKININENETNLKAAEEIVSFNHTKFGSFGLMSGDDILYTQPAKKLTDNEVKTIIYTTSMRSIAPFKTGGWLTSRLVEKCWELKSEILKEISFYST